MAATTDKKFTPEQLDAIHAQGGSLLLSAAAGSGKTAVLVERVIRKLTDPEHPVDADRLLIATFSKAAASEMKERIAARLAQLLEKEPNHRQLQRQQVLLERASIGTIHSFCLDLIRENFQRLAISPDFRIADENEAEILLSQAIEEVLEQFYSREDSVFFELVELISSSRDDRQLLSTVTELYRFIRSIAFYGDWLEEKLKLYQPGQKIGDTVWAKILFSHAEDTLNYVISRLSEAVSEMENDASMTEKYRPAFELDLKQAQKLLQLCESRDWDGMVYRLRHLEFSTLGSLTKYPDTEKKNRVSAIRNEEKDILKGLAESGFSASGEQFAEDLEDLYPKVKKLFELTMACDDRYSELKLEKKLVDFSDLEHLTIQLLTDRRDGQYVPSKLAERLSLQYEEILVDEYQDTNQAQELIFSMLSRNGENLFLVGDVKQSIYRFRKAMPEIFLAKKAAYPLYDGVHFPAKILLNRNFRSRKEVTEAVNFLFTQLMSEQVGEIDYGESEKLIPEAAYPPSELSGTQIEFLDLPRDCEDAAAAQARLIAREILSLLESRMPVYENGAFRPIRQKDIVILLRSPKGRAEIYRKALTEVGISALADSQNGFLESREIMALLSVLRVIDNPLLDIPLAASLLSPLFHFTADELALIRLEEPGQPLYHALVKRAEKDERCRKFLEQLHFFREQSFFLPTDRLIRLVCEKTGFSSTVQFFSNAKTRKNNVNLLIEYAYQYEEWGYKGLSGFLRFIDKIEEKNGDLTAASPVGDASDLVRIMSIHHSKGLEFPVVFLAGCEKEFNRSDLNQSTLLHPQIGFACVRRDREGKRQFSTVPMQAMKLELERSMLSEEMRLLYVALTRAKERLILVASSKNISARVSKAACLGVGGKLPIYTVQNAKSYLDWLLPALLSHPDSRTLTEYSGVLTSLERETAFCRIKMNIRKDAEPVSEDLSLHEEKKTEEKADPNLILKLKNAYSYRYPHQEATERRAKLSVSELVKKDGEQGNRFSKRPDFLLGKGLSPTEKGNAAHKFMQFCDYDAARKDVNAELNRLTQLRFLLPEESKAIHTQEIKAFFESPLADRIFQADRLYRELKFLNLTSPEGVSEEACETAVQGVADCVFIEKNEAVVVDFKTDRVKSEEVLIERYHAQLSLYRKILKEALGMPVKEALLYSFALGRSIPVPEEE